jgi:transposase
LRELSRLDEQIKNELHRTANQLWEQLHRYFPQMLKLSSGADDPFVWELLKEAPLPATAAKLKVSRVEQILKSHRIRRLTADQVVAVLGEPSLQPAPGAAEPAAEHVLFLLPRLALLNVQIKDVARRTAKLLKELPENLDPNGNAREYRDVDLLLSLPGLGQTIASTILAEASRPIRERDYEELRCYAGTAPVTKQSSKRRMVSMRHACSERIRQTVFHWSSRSIMLDSRSRQHYDKLRAAGHCHARALRGVGDRLLAVLTAILQSGKPFDASLRGTFPT